MGASQIGRTAYEHSGPGFSFRTERVPIVNLRLQENRMRARTKLRDHLAIQNQAGVTRLHLKIAPRTQYMRAAGDIGVSRGQTVGTGKWREYWNARENLRTKRRRATAIFNTHYRGRHAAGLNVSDYRISDKKIGAQLCPRRTCLDPRQITQETGNQGQQRSGKGGKDGAVLLRIDAATTKEEVHRRWLSDRGRDYGLAFIVALAGIVFAMMAYAIMVIFR
jgi:hypothetical protein